MAPLGPKSYLQVSSEKLKTNMTSIWNLCLRKWVFVQKWHFLLKKWGSFTPPGPPRFAGHGSFGPQILPTCLLWETGKKYDLHVKSVAQKMSFCPKLEFFIEKMRWFYPPRNPTVCRAWLIWAPNSTYKSPLRNCKKIWPSCDVGTKCANFRYQKKHF